MKCRKDFSGPNKQKGSCLILPCIGCTVPGTVRTIEQQDREKSRVECGAVLAFVEPNFCLLTAPSARGSSSSVRTPWLLSSHSPGFLKNKISSMYSVLRILLIDSTLHPS